MNKDEIRKIIDAENGEGFSKNIDLSGYIFQRNGSFMCHSIAVVDGIKVAQIKYLHYDNEKDLITILAYACNFWMGNNVRFIFMREKERNKSAVEYMEDLGFEVDPNIDYEWKKPFKCVKGEDPCTCRVLEVYR